MKKLGCIALTICMGILVCYGIYSFDQVNKDNDKTKITYLYDDSSHIVDELRYTAQKEEVLDVASLFERYPDTEDEFPNIGEPVEDGGGGRLKVLLLHIKFKNMSSSAKYIDLIDYIIKAPAYYTAMSPKLFGIINEIENTKCAFYSGVEKELILPYEMSESSFSREHFENLEKQPFSLVLKGYPDSHELCFTKIQNVAGDSEAYYKKLKMSQKIQDTEEGKILETSEECICEGVGYRLTDFQYVGNVKDYAAYDEKYLWYKEGVTDTGQIVTMDGDTSNADRDTYMVFIQSTLKNHSAVKKKVFVPVRELGYYGRKHYAYEATYLYFQCSKKDDDGFVTLDPGEEIEAVTGFAVLNAKKYWDINKSDFYVQLSGFGSGMGDPDKTDPRNGIIGRANYFVIRAKK